MKLLQFELMTKENTTDYTTVENYLGQLGKSIITSASKIIEEDFVAIDPVVGKVDIPTVLTAEMVMETIGKELQETLTSKRSVVIANFDYGVAYTFSWESVNGKAEVTQSVIHNKQIVAKFVSTYRTAMNDAVDDGMVSIIVDLVKREKAKVSV